VYAARVAKPASLKLAQEYLCRNQERAYLAIWYSQARRLTQELTLTRDVFHENILTMDALYVDLVEDSLWIRMELMERSLADVGWPCCGRPHVQERMIARFASDVSFTMNFLCNKRGTDSLPLAIGTFGFRIPSKANI